MIEEGFDADTDIENAKNAVLRYVNGLGINGDVIFNELVHQVMAVPGLFDINFVQPTGNVVVGAAEVIRISAPDVDLT